MLKAEADLCFYGAVPESHRREPSVPTCSPRGKQEFLKPKREHWPQSRKLRSDRGTLRKSCPEVSKACFLPPLHPTEKKPCLRKGNRFSLDPTLDSSSSHSAPLLWSWLPACFLPERYSPPSPTLPWDSSPAPTHPSWKS